MAELDRRTFIVSAAGFAGAGALLAACGDDGDASPTSTTTTTTTLLAQNGDEPGALDIPQMLPAFPEFAMVHSVPQRVAYALHDGIDIMRANAPDSINLVIRFGDEVIAAEELYYQCAKAVIRSGLWSRDDAEGLPTAGQFAKEMVPEFDAEGYDSGYAEYARGRLW